MKVKTSIPFTKMHGIGNDYIYIDALKEKLPDYLKEEFLPGLSRKISDRHKGVGSDGLILILPSSIADFRMRIFNADGSEAKMCGNGIRCVGKYVYESGYTKKTHITIETNSGVKELEIQPGKTGVEKIIVNMGYPKFNKGALQAKGEFHQEMVDEELECGEEKFKVTGVSMGNPHGVIFIKDLNHLMIEDIGPSLENNPVWEDRANIEFVEVKNRKEINVRVWERGSGETMACGTGACAAAVASYKKGLTDSKVTVHLKGGDLYIDYNIKANRVKMEGGAEFVAKGEFLME